MLLYFFIIFSLYFIFILLMIYGWNGIPNARAMDHAPDVKYISLIIAVRNEEKNINRLLACISTQSYPHDRFEVVFIDDNSTDNTVSEISKIKESVSFSIKIMPNKPIGNDGISPKKAALQLGIEASKGQIIAMTDGDCWFGEDWLKAISTSFENEKTMFVSGPVAISGEKRLLSRIQTLEFASLIGTGAALIHLKYPLMCNGANLAFRKAAFLQVNGYAGIEKQTSGDDVFLMQKIHRANPGSVKFIKNPDAVVRTRPEPTISSLINQRKRWASKWGNYLLPMSWLLPVFLFIQYLSIILLVIGAIFGGFPHYWVLGTLLSFKIILDGILLKKVMDFCNLPFSFWIFLLSEFLYPAYAIFIGISVHFGGYSWKGRKHKV